jgi:maltooligosyltrehalose trehalohydrolase
VAVLLSPFTPLLFMGEEYRETAPFLYFVSHTDPDLVEAVRQGRKQEFAAFAAFAEAPDPQDEATYLRSKLNASRRWSSGHREMEQLHRELLRLRRELPAITGEGFATEVHEHRDALVVHRRSRRASGGDAVLVLAFGRDEPVPLPAGDWRVVLDTAKFPDAPADHLAGEPDHQTVRPEPWSAVLLTA